MKDTTAALLNLSRSKGLSFACRHKLGLVGVQLVSRWMTRLNIITDINQIGAQSDCEAKERSACNIAYVGSFSFHHAQ